MEVVGAGVVEDALEPASPVPPAGDAAVLEDCFSGFQCRRGDDCDQVLDAELARDRAVVFAHGVGGAVGAAGVRVGDQRVAAGNHVDRVGG